MRFRNALLVVSCSILLSCVAFLPAARADQWDQMTKFEFSQPVEIPGSVLPAGTYWFRLLDSSSDRDVVQIFSPDWTKLYATLITIPTHRQVPTGDTEIKLAERSHRQPEALLKWYYPGLINGHEFLYSYKREIEFARDAKQDLHVEPATMDPTATVSHR